MISVVICSINKELSDQLVHNIESTIGVPWEPLVRDNRILKQSITRVYNEAAATARYDIVCFVHEDVIFKTQDWGKHITQAFTKDVYLGLIGVGGSKYKSAAPSGWFTGIKQLDCCNIEHVNTKGELNRLYFNPDPSVDLQPVVVVDGVFICCPTKVWQRIRFDEHLLTGFHLYDIDFSIRVARHYHAVVTFNVDILHLTEGGNYGDEWVKFTLLWHQHMAKSLPFHTDEVKGKLSFEKIIMRNWLIRLKHENINVNNKLAWLKHNKAWNNLSAWPNILMLFLKPFLNRSK